MIVILSFLLPIITVIYLNYVISSFFESIGISADSLITYVAGFEAFIGTVFLGVVAARQNDKANELNERLLDKEEKRDAFDRQPCLMISGGTFKAVSTRTEKYTLAFDFINASKAFVQVWIVSIIASGQCGTITPQFEKEQVNLESVIYHFNPHEKKNIDFSFDEDALAVMKCTECELKLIMINSLGEQFSEDIRFFSKIKDDSIFSIGQVTYKTTPIL